MPVIRNYRQQVGTPRPARPVRTTPQAFGSMEAQATGQIGNALQNVGNALNQRAIQKEVSQANAAVAKRGAELTIELEQTIRNSPPGEEEAFKKFQEKSANAFTELQEKYSSPAARQRIAESGARINGHLRQKAFQGKAELAGIAAEQNIREVFNSASATVLADPSSIETQREFLDSAIEDQVTLGYLPRAAADQLKEEQQKELTVAELRGVIKLSPDVAKRMLEQDLAKEKGNKTGEPKSTYVKQLGSNGALKMLAEADQAIRAQDVEKARLQRQMEQVAEQQRELVRGEFLELATENKLTKDQILNSNLQSFGSGSKDQFIRMIESSNSEPLKTNQQVFTNLFDRINRPEGDPEKITDENDLNRYVIDRQITITDLNRLRKEMRGFGTGDAEVFKDIRRSFFNKAKNQIVKSDQFGNPISGSENYYQFQTKFYDYYEKQIEQGKNPKDLLDPNSKEYLGWLVDFYVRTPEEQARDFSAFISGTATSGESPDLPEKMPNETPDEYLERMNVFIGAETEKESE